MWQAGGLTFCTRCGYDSQARCGLLALPCRGGPKRGNVTVRRRLLLGLHPTTRRPLGLVKRYRQAALDVDVDCWAALSRQELGELDLALGGWGAVANVAPDGAVA